MPNLNIFVSFEFDKDNELKTQFYQQAQKLTQHRVRNCSLNESYPDQCWKNKAKKSISECDVVIVLIVEDTHNASGVIVETDIARSLNKPIIQIRPQPRSYKGLTRLDDPIPWKWKRINTTLDAILPRKR